MRPRSIDILLVSGADRGAATNRQQDADNGKENFPHRRAYRCPRLSSGFLSGGLAPSSERRRQMGINVMSRHHSASVTRRVRCITLN